MIKIAGNENLTKESTKRGEEMYLAGVGTIELFSSGTVLVHYPNGPLPMRSSPSMENQSFLHPHQARL